MNSPSCIRYSLHSRTCPKHGARLERHHDRRWYQCPKQVPTAYPKPSELHRSRKVTVTKLPYISPEEVSRRTRATPFQDRVPVFPKRRAQRKSHTTAKNSKTRDTRVAETAGIKNNRRRRKPLRAKVPKKSSQTSHLRYVAILGLAHSQLPGGMSVRPLSPVATVPID